MRSGGAGAKGGERYSGGSAAILYYIRRDWLIGRRWTLMNGLAAFFFCLREVEVVNFCSTDCVATIGL